MFCLMFVWEPGKYDAEFHRLNGLINKLAESTPGFLGSESWLSDDGKRRCANYYWDNLDAVRAFSSQPGHQEAKRQYLRWYKGFHIVVTEVLRSCGDGGIAHITPNDRSGSESES